MTLNFKFATPYDMLEKAKRELEVLDAAITSQDELRINDSLYNFSVTVYHVKDWLIENPSTTYSKQDVDGFVSATPSLSIWRDIGNASKHKTIRKYPPTASTVLASSASFTIVDDASVNGPIQRKPTFRMKVITEDGKRLEVVALARDAIAAWEAFFRQNGL